VSTRTALFALVQCHTGYLTGFAKARALVVPIALVALPIGFAVLALRLGFARTSDGSRSIIHIMIGVMVALGSLVLAFMIFVLLAVSGSFAPCA
jgi:hypothetical protein